MTDDTKARLGETRVVRYTARAVLAVVAAWVLYGIAYGWRWSANTGLWPFFDAGDQVTVGALLGGLLVWLAVAAFAVAALYRLCCLAFPTDREGPRGS